MKAAAFTWCFRIDTAPKEHRYRIEDADRDAAWCVEAACTAFKLPMPGSGGRFTAGRPGASYAVQEDGGDLFVFFVTCGPAGIFLVVTGEPGSAYEIRHQAALAWRDAVVERYPSTGLHQDDTVVDLGDVEF